MDTNSKNNEDIQPLSPEEIKAIGEIALGPSKHEQFLNAHYKKLMWGGITLGIVAGGVIAFFSHRNDMRHPRYLRQPDNEILQPHRNRLHRYLYNQ